MIIIFLFKGIIKMRPNVAPLTNDIITPTLVLCKGDQSQMHAIRGDYAIPAGVVKRHSKG